MKTMIRIGDEVVCVNGYENVGLAPQTGWTGVVKGMGKNQQPFIFWYVGGMSSHCHVNRLKVIEKEAPYDNGMAIDGMCFIPSSEEVKNAVVLLASAMGINTENIDPSKPVVVYREYGMVTSDNIADDKVDVGELDFIRRLMKKVEDNRVKVQEPTLETAKELAIRAFNLISKLQISKVSDMKYRSELMNDMARYGLNQITLDNFIFGANRGEKMGVYTPVNSSTNGTVEAGHQGGA